MFQFHDRLVSKYGGLAGFRDEAQARYTYGIPSLQLFGAENDGQYAYPFPYGMAGAYLFFGAKDHPFNDGNKRTALGTCLMFLLLNGLRLNVKDDELVELAVKVASGETRRENIVAFLTLNSKSEKTQFTPEEALDYLLYYYDDVFRELSCR